ncbi:MAG: Rieske (2Fe-2S) protein [Bacteroidota bacterium]|nr:Rieske (2Fe-2S) protein [Bacteroidota bacterium]MDP4213619.1 Rieske (2Fe-2S) protein [Bacteroidota bacterium]MDP4248477.1 Rieske (2Fe-2S) protein [Bacteroidota bacterium]
MNTERRKFIKSSCNFCLMAAGGFLLSELSACSPAVKVLKVPVSGNTVTIPLNAFASGPQLIVRPSGWYYDIAVRKKEKNTYEALFLQCTHQQNQLVVDPHGYKCNLHGSQFDEDGKVVKGPAGRPLKRFNTTIGPDQLIIQLKD